MSLSCVTRMPVAPGTTDATPSAFTVKRALNAGRSSFAATAVTQSFKRSCFSDTTYR